MTHSNNGMIKKTKDLLPTITLLLVYIILMVLIVIYGIKLFYNTTDLWSFVTLLLLLMIIAYFDRIEDLKFLGLSMKLKEKITEADIVISRLKRLEIFIYRQRVIQVVNNDTIEKHVTCNSYAICKQSSVDSEIDALLGEIGAISENDKNYILEPYHIYKMSQIALKILTESNSALGYNLKANEPLDPTNVDSVKNMLASLETKPGNKTSILKELINEINQWILKIEDVHR